MPTPQPLEFLRVPDVRSIHSTHRPGLVTVELLIAAAMVVTMLSVAAPTIIRSARIWKQTRHHQFACDELSGQMDLLIALPDSAREQAINSLTVSPEIRAVLHDATLDGELVADESGKRIVLKINWQRLGDPEPIALVAWIDPLPETDSAQPETESENNQGADQ